ncbi:MAG: TPR end-of-group domain-containing protein [Phycisphaerales bacterium]
MRPPSYSSVVSLAALLGFGVFAVMLVTGAPSENESRRINRRQAAADRPLPRPTDPDAMEAWLAGRLEGPKPRPFDWLDYGRKRSAQGRIKDAEDAWRNAQVGYAEGSLTNFARFRSAPEAWCNFARVNALVGDFEGAITALTRAAEEGYADADQAAADPEFEPIRSDPRFETALKRMRQNPRIFNAG